MGMRCGSGSFLVGRRANHRIEVGDLVGDTHTRKALEKVAAVAFCFEARVKDGDHAAVSSAAYKTSDPLFERDHGLRQAVIKE